MRIVVPVYNKRHWALKPFSILFNKYWGGAVDVMCYSIPNMQLPSNFNIVSVDPEDFPRDKWVDGLLIYLNAISDNTVIILLEDYWLVRKVDTDGVAKLAGIIDDEVLRVDLTTDRLYAGGMRDIGYVGHYDIIEAPGSQYQMSLQAGIWNRKLLIDVLNQLPPKNHSAWDVELDGTNIVNDKGYRVFGTRQYPVRYVNGANDAKGIQVNFRGVTEEDKEIMVKYSTEQKELEKKNERKNRKTN
jgi:hypothetical protein